VRLEISLTPPGYDMDPETVTAGRVFVAARPIKGKGSKTLAALEASHASGRQALTGLVLGIYYLLVSYL